MDKQVIFRSVVKVFSDRVGTGDKAEQLGLSMGIPDNLTEIMKNRVAADLAVQSRKYPETIMLVYCLDSKDDYSSIFNQIIDCAKAIQHYKNVVLIIARAYDTDVNTYHMDTYVFKTHKNTYMSITNVPLNTVEEYFNLPNTSNFSIQSMVNNIWKCADILAGAFKPYEYGEIIIPLVVLKRIAQTFEDMEQEFNNVLNRIKQESPTISDKSAYESAMSELDMTFCNTYPGGINAVLANPYSCLDNLADYIDSFIVNGVDDEAFTVIFDNLKIDEVISRLEDSGKGYHVLQSLFDPAINLSTNVVSTDEMGQIFESLIYLFNTAVGSGAGEHYTAPDIVKTMSNILTELVDINGFTTLDAYDMTMGTSQMLTVLEEYFNNKYTDGSRQLVLHGQELNGYTFGIACADAILRGVNVDDVIRNFRHGNTLSNDQFKGRQFDYIISNPPFGISWTSDYDYLYSESLQPGGGRFPFGLPARSDGQMLFTCNGLTKLKKHGAMAIIQNGSPLFNGGNGSGEALIREGFLSNDYVTAIIKLPKDMFYNVGIVTYIWVMQVNKSRDRENKVWLIDASACCKKLAKSIGNKRNEITDACREAILKAFNSMEDDKFEVEGLKDAYCSVKIVDPQSFKGEADNQGRYKWEIPFDKLFAESTNRESSDIIAKRIIKTAKEMNKHLVNLFGTEVIEGTEEV